ncbi:unnamed protein product [Ixodes pacificus]
MIRHKQPQMPRLQGVRMTPKRSSQCNVIGYAPALIAITRYTFSLSLFQFMLSARVYGNTLANPSLHSEL